MSSFNKKRGAGKETLTRPPLNISKASVSPQRSNKRGNTSHISKDELATGSRKGNDHPSNTVEVEMPPHSTQEKKTGERGRMGTNDRVHHVEQGKEICGTDDDDDNNVFINWILYTYSAWYSKFMFCTCSFCWIDIKYLLLIYLKVLLAWWFAPLTDCSQKRVSIAVVSIKWGSADSITWNRYNCDCWCFPLLAFSRSPQGACNQSALPHYYFCNQTYQRDFFQTTKPYQRYSFCFHLSCSVCTS